MNLVSYDPNNLFDQVRKEFDSMLQRHFNYGEDSNDISSVVTSRWAPAVDIREEAEQFTITADIPGVDPKEIEITMEGNVLSLRGERKREHEANEKGYRRVERTYGSFYRRFALPDTADAEGVKAEGKNGVLSITIPKHPKAQPKRITITG